jgi:Domain of unknown function DUF29
LAASAALDPGADTEAVARTLSMSERKVGAASTRRPKAASERAMPYEQEVILWSQEQARLLRAGRFSELDIEHLADEIDDVGKSEKHELASRMAVLLAHILKWSRQPQNRGNSCRATINDQRKRIVLAIKATPSLKMVMRDRDWRQDVWLDALIQARNETGLAEEDLPEACPWSIEQAADADFWPD